MKKKILILSDSSIIGGVSKSLISLLQSIDYEEYEVTLLLESRGELHNQIPSNVNIIKPPSYYKWIFIPKQTWLLALISSIGVNLNVFKFIFFTMKGVFIKNMGQARQELLEAVIHTLPNFENAYDCAIDYNGGYKKILIEKVNAKKKLTWVHSDYRVYKRNKFLDFQDYSMIDNIITVSETCHDIFIKEFPEFSSKTKIIPNLINKHQIRELSNVDVDFDNDFKGLKILDITRLDPDKGLDLAIEACKILVNKGYNIRWYILGEGPERPLLEKMISEYELQDHFILLGSRSNPYPFIKQADIIVHCSKFEGKSIAIDEAMLLAKPIILTNYPTAKDQINHGQNGLICEMNPQGIVDAVGFLIDNKDERSKFISELKDFDKPVEESTSLLYSLI